MSTIKTYHLHQGDGADLQWTRTRLLFSAVFSFGPMNSGSSDYRIGPTACGRYDALWVESEEREDPSRMAIAWIAKGELKGPELWHALLNAMWTADKQHWDYSRPAMEVSFTPNALLEASEVHGIVDAVWP